MSSCLCYTYAMIKGRLSSGYTIIEIMVVLAVSSALLISGLLLLNGRQQKTAFNQSVHNTQSTIDQVINNSVIGYYAGAGKFKCSASADGPHFTPPTGPTTPEQGTSQNCVFMGRAIQFGDGTNKTKYNIFNIAGLRLKWLSTTQLASTLTEARPTAISSGNTTNDAPGFPDTTESRGFDQSFDVSQVAYTAGGSPTLEHDSNVVAFMTDLPKVSGVGGVNVASGSRTVGLYVVKGTGGSMAKKAAVDVINTGTPANFVEADSVKVCFQGPGPNNYAIITIGGLNNKQLSTNLSFNTTGCP